VDVSWNGVWWEGVLREVKKDERKATLLETFCPATGDAVPLSRPDTASAARPPADGDVRAAQRFSDGEWTPGGQAGGGQTPTKKQSPTPTPAPAPKPKPTKQVSAKTLRAGGTAPALSVALLKALFLTPRRFARLVRACGGDASAAAAKLPGTLVRAWSGAGGAQSGARVKAKGSGTNTSPTLFFVRGAHSRQAFGTPEEHAAKTFVTDANGSAHALQSLLVTPPSLSQLAGFLASDGAHGLTPHSVRATLDALACDAAGEVAVDEAPAGICAQAALLASWQGNDAPAWSDDDEDAGNDGAAKGKGKRRAEEPQTEAASTPVPASAKAPRVHMPPTAPAEKKEGEEQALLFACTSRKCCTPGVPAVQPQHRLWYYTPPLPLEQIRQGPFCLYCLKRPAWRSLLQAHLVVQEAVPGAQETTLGELERLVGWPWPGAAP